MAQLGVAMCPCDGSLTPDEYAPELTPLTEAISGRPHALLDPLVDRMRQQMIELRYEEAAWTRDRYRALVRALQRRRQWTELQEAGRLEAVTAGGEQAEILMGHFLRSWKTKDGRPLSAVGDPEPPTCVPSTVGVAEEARLIWRWLERPDTEIIECSGATPEPSVSIGMVNAL